VDVRRQGGVRLDAAQQSLVREHERVHIVRGDQIANLLAVVLSCVHMLAATTAPLSGQIRFGHPLNQRIATLRRQLPTTSRRISSGALMPTIVAVAGCAANAAHAPQLAIRNGRPVAAKVVIPVKFDLDSHDGAAKKREPESF
jgi:hypothetical protein